MPSQESIQKEIRKKEIDEVLMDNDIYHDFTSAIHWMKKSEDHVFVYSLDEVNRGYLTYLEKIVSRGQILITEAKQNPESEKEELKYFMVSTNYTPPFYHVTFYTESDLEEMKSIGETFEWELGEMPALQILSPDDTRKCFRWLTMGEFY